MGELVTRRIAVTGATGFIGRHLVADLIARGVEARAIVRPSAGSPQRLGLHPGTVVVRAALEGARWRRRRKPPASG
jgi:uncharacterized protein YbjT (DUF2867 family)